MHATGYYKINYRAIRLQEWFRMLKWFLLPLLPLIWLVTRFMRSRAGTAIWMPSLWRDTECRKEDLSVGFWQATAGHRRALEQLGFTECGFSQVKKHLNPNYRDTGRITYLDRSRGHIGKLFYMKIHVRPPFDVDREFVKIEFTAIFEKTSLICTNNKFAVDALSPQTVVRLSTTDTALIYERFLQCLKKFPDTPRCFPDEESLRHWWDAKQTEAFDEAMRRGLFVRVEDAEAEKARRGLAPARQPVRM
jgi:hypothetical protein